MVEGSSYRRELQLSGLGKQIPFLCAKIKGTEQQPEAYAGHAIHRKDHIGSKTAHDRQASCHCAKDSQGRTRHLYTLRQSVQSAAATSAQRPLLDMGRRTSHGSRAPADGQSVDKQSHWSRTAACWRWQSYNHPCEPTAVRAIARRTLWGNLGVVGTELPHAKVVYGRQIRHFYSLGCIQCAGSRQRVVCQTHV